MTIRTKAAADRPGPLGRLARRLFFKILANARYGRLRLTLPDGRTEIIQGETEGPHVELRIADARFFTALARSGDIGFGEAYTEGWWTSPDLPELLRFFVLNREAMRFSRAVAVPQPIVSLYRGLRRLGGRRNHKNGARENIRRHYDLGDDLFHTFLDPSMAYSSAVFEREDMSLAEAQRAKFRKIAEKANLKPGDRVLEIGCGWGGFAAYAAEHHGCHVTGLTISDHQHEHARALAAEKGLQELMDIRKMDYRDVEGAGAYDAIVSIEMLEAVGHEYHETFYETLERLLAPDGVAVVQVIVIRDQRYNAYRFEGDWSRKHIFPGGLLPSLTRLAEVMRSRSTLMVRDIEAIGPHYARTLAEWRKRFLTAADVLEEHGYDERFRRTWDYYFAYCQAGFACRVIDDYQIVMDRPQGVGIRT
jgi:cyclopropane-fatty-acyl-phospholipid synthase